MEKNIARLEKVGNNMIYYEGQEETSRWCCAGLCQSALPQKTPSDLYRTLNQSESATVFGHDRKVESYRHG